MGVGVYGSVGLVCGAVRCGEGCWGQGDLQF